MSRAQGADLDALLEQVCDEVTFVAFVNALANDFALEQELERAEPSNPYGPGRLGWEHSTVDNVLGAAAAWGHAKPVPGQSASVANPWQRCAHILYAGKWYE